MDEIDKFSIEIHLVVCSKDPARFLVRITPDNKYVFPSALLTKGKLPQTLATNLLFDLTGLTGSWVVLQSFAIPSTVKPEDMGDSVPILYACFIPEPVRLSGEGYTWIEYNELRKDDICSPLTLSLCHEAIYKRI